MKKPITSQELSNAQKFAEQQLPDALNAFNLSVKEAKEKYGKPLSTSWGGAVQKWDYGTKELSKTPRLTIDSKDKSISDGSLQKVQQSFDEIKKEIDEKSPKSDQCNGIDFEPQYSPYLEKMQSSLNILKDIDNLLKSKPITEANLPSYVDGVNLKNHVSGSIKLTQEYTKSAKEEFKWPWLNGPCVIRR
jgi:hypothetical protein